MMNDPILANSLIISYKLELVGVGSHSWIASRRRARRPSVLCHSGFLWVIKWTETRGNVTLTQRLGPACMKQRRS
jgi:hypothetical protein